MKVKVQIDQAVWERCEFEVEIDDDVPPDQLQEHISDAVDAYDGFGEESHQQFILDEPVLNLDSERKAILPDGTELEF